MSKQSEAVLEDNLVKQLTELGYERVVVPDEPTLLLNFRTQLERHNKTSLSQTEFERVLNHLNQGDVFDKAKRLRDRFALQKDNGDTIYIAFLNQENWSQNTFQVTNQITIKGKYDNRYDVSILINGLPLVHIELKRRGLEIKEAFNQVNRYQKQSFGARNALFQYVQIFVVSNGVNTKYYSNNNRQHFKQTFFWADKENKNITNLDQFAGSFLDRSHVTKMICKYIVAAEVTKILMILRPYQYYAVEAIIDRITNTSKNGYIWHTTGSGKTLTSFKAAQILTQLPDVEKVVFVVDRKDLDFQTTREFNSFSDGSVDGTDNTTVLVNQFIGKHKDKKGVAKDSNLIITTIQKLNTAISKPRHLAQMEAIKDRKVIFIFDECHRSQFGETHKNITNFFTNSQLIGFTGTPIFPENAIGNQFGKRTTAELFDSALHKYVITDAINDDNVLRFSVEYVGRYREKDSSATEIDIEVENIDTKELLESEDRINKITDYVLANHDRKTHSREFTAMMCVSSIDVLCKYYETFKQKNHKLKIATIFSFTANEEDRDATGIYDFDDLDSRESSTGSLHSREKLESYIADYNKLFECSFTTKDSQGFYDYYNDISKRVKTRQIDLLLVVSMFQTGFDSVSLNTLYVDKNLKYHGLLQAFSRTNRILNDKKSQGNIVCFRNLKKNTDDAIALFSNKDAKDIILMQPYEDYVQRFNADVIALLELTPSVDSVNDLPDENAKLAFVQAFRTLMRTHNILIGFSDFKWADLTLAEQTYEDFKSKYLDIFEQYKGYNKGETVSILHDVDFELELIGRDLINVAYILELLARYLRASTESRPSQRESILKLLETTPDLRSKRELIEAFIQNQLDGLDPDSVAEEFEDFVAIERKKSLDKLVIEEDLLEDELDSLIENYLYDGRTPLKDDVAKTMKKKPKLLERRIVVPQLLSKITSFVETYYF